MMTASNLAAALPARLRLPLPRLSARLPGKAVVAAVAFVVFIVLLSHMPNMLHYPYVEQDEGYYFSQGWAVIHEGRLAPYPYPYYYEHAPLGWIQIGLWQLLSGGASFGSYAVASGRVLMLLFQIGSSLLVFSIARNVSGRIWVGVLAALIFTLTPFGIYYQRRVLLDNIAAFWILVSLWALVKTITLRRAWLSAAALGIAVLSKEPAVAVIPAMAVLTWRRAPKENRLFAVVGWAAVAGAVISTYPLMALLRGEFFPAGSPLGGYHKHVSLLCSLEWQTSRGPHDGGVLYPSSDFWNFATNWAHRAPLLVAGGSLTAIISIIFCRRTHVIPAIGWMIVSLWLFFGRGGVIIDFYVVPLLPLLALSIALVANEGIQAIGQATPAMRSRMFGGVLVCCVWMGCAAGLAGAYQRSGLDLWRNRQVDAQVEAERWIQRHVPPDSRMLINMSMWFDLQNPTGGTPAFRYAEYSWKAYADPSIAKSVFSNNWRTVNYVVTDPEVMEDTAVNGFSLGINALNHSTAVAQFDSGGWPVVVRRVNPRLPSNHMLSLRRHFYQVPACMTYGT